MSATPVVWLYVPGDRPERFAKALSSGADAVIIDLEDAVAPAAKDRARAHVADFLTDDPTAGPPDIQVRVNDLATARGRDDLAAIAGLPGLASVRLPKVEDTETLDVFDRLVPDTSIAAWALLESARGLAATTRIAGHPRVAGLALGEVDLGAELSITAPTALDHIRVQTVLAAGAAGLAPVAMSVYANIADREGLLESSRHGRTLGMWGRTALHPAQIPAIREAFAPTAEEVARAREVVEAAESAASDGIGAVALPDGRFLDAPVLAKAQRVLALAARR
ncbi:CoA ester lyase [Streptomyces sp. NBC_00006]|uniref:HpcH/HpaI aldolase/citrate lyase family protein n=1 Tax=unclassified Streptomyces TaxID=2593676 RepID=UPI00224D57DF|nr:MULTISPECIES: CoA ester lyase [unclassified Streptomyces]MCX5535863.1 CoA ester lyase [Streptomyces sp. NBC_00006]